jgi:hypothetical protein
LSYFLIDVSKFSFGTAAEVSANPAQKVLAEINKEGLCHPNLFGDEKLREQKWIDYLFNLRQKLAKEKKLIK